MRSDSRKTIAILSAGNRGGGSETVLRGLLPFLVRDNPNYLYHLFIAKSRQPFYELKADNLVVHTVDDEILDKPIKRLGYENLTIFRELKKLNPSVCLFTSEVFTPLLALLKIPVVNVYHAAMQFYMRPGLDESRLKLRYTKLMRSISIRIAKRTIAVSHFERAEIGGRYPKYMMDKIAVVYHGLDHEYFRLPISEAEREPSPFPFTYILCVGDRHRHKRIEDMLRVYSIMIHEFETKEHLVIIGRPKSHLVENGIASIIEEESLQEKVHMIDYIDNKEIRTYYWNARVYWTHTSCESFGLTPLEAMACGAPVFCAWESALPEIYGSAAMFYDPHFSNRKEIAIMLKGLIEDASLREVHINRGLNHIKKFSWKNSAAKYQKVLEMEMRSK